MDFDGFCGFFIGYEIFTVAMFDRIVAMTGSYIFMQVKNSREKHGLL